jgi:Lrp/AsnC family leucine-responsive transcriptional regulator
MAKSPTTVIAEPSALDHIDRQLLMALQEDARTSVAALARHVHLTPTPCQLRLSRLERDGYIESFGARINAERAGFTLLAYIAVTLDRVTPDIFEHFHHAVQDVDEIEECQMTAGGFDYLLKIRARSMADFRRFLGNRLITLPGLMSTQSYFVMEVVKSHARLNLRPHLRPVRRTSVRDGVSLRPIDPAALTDLSRSTILKPLRTRRLILGFKCRAPVACDRRSRAPAYDNRHRNSTVQV